MPARRPPPPPASLAARADRFALYQRTVQGPADDVAFFSRVYRRRNGRLPLKLREDFCGTAYLSATWVGSHPRRTALGIDLDPEPLAWGREHNLTPAIAPRVRLLEANVLDVRRPRADVTCALNFSFCVFHRRAELLAYLRTARAGLAPGGLLFLELYGGTEAVVAMTERRRSGSVTYLWEQASFNPIDHHTVCYIHFAFRDGSRLDRAFRYDWRLWTIPELRDCLAEAGFASSEVWWDRVADGNVDTETYVRTVEEENQESWLVYVVGSK